MPDTTILHSIETPVTDRVDSRKVTIHGWCFDSNGGLLKGIRAHVGSRVFKANRKQSRPRIGRIHPNAQEAGRSGFSVEVELPRGQRSEVVLECRTADGQWQYFETLSLKAPWFCWPWRKSVSAVDWYQLWIKRYDRISDADRARMKAQIEEMKVPLVISVIVPIYNAPEKWLLRMIESVKEQIYPHWELCLADDFSTDPHIRKLLQQAVDSDTRVKVYFREENGHISAASNSALELATGKFIALLDNDDELPPDALYWVAKEVEAHPGVDVIYSDEDKIDEDGRRSGPYFKPDFNYDLLLSQNCISHLGIYRTDLVRSIGGFRVGMEGSQDWDLALRMLEHSDASKIRHIPRILYHWRVLPGSTALNNSEKPYAAKAGQRAVQEHLERMKLEHTKVEHCGVFLRVVWSLPDPVPPVTLIMPTRNMLDLLQVAVQTVLEKTDYPKFELLIVDNESDEPDVQDYLAEVGKDPRVRVIQSEGEFNFSRLNNFAVSQTTNPIIALINNDIEVVNGDWLREMVSQAVRKEVGAVGAALLYPSGLIQHAGVVIGMVSGAGHPFRGLAQQEISHGGRGGLVQNFSAVTAACLVVERNLYEEVGGLDEGVFRVGLNDVDFCLKLAKAGYRNLFTPFAELVHHESASRADMERTPEGANRAAGENSALAAKWPEYFEHDPSWNPNLSLLIEDGALAFPPRLIDLGGREYNNIFDAQS